MPTIVGEQICTTDFGPAGKAKSIILAMNRLLMQRYRHIVTRRVFLTRWDKLRKALFLTTEYQDLKWRVHSRHGGMCEVCMERTAVHVHHVKPVSRYPHKALDDANCKSLCGPCHTEAHNG